LVQWSIHAIPYRDGGLTVVFDCQFQAPKGRHRELRLARDAYHWVLGPYVLNTTDCVLEEVRSEGKVGASAAASCGKNHSKEGTMLRWAVAFFIIAIIAAIFGFGGIAVAAAGIAKILFFIFLVLFLVALLSGLVRRA
jgi:uncharacterized membrane protein YtjA (UPF0391 family)